MSVLSVIVPRELATALRKSPQNFFCDTRIFLLQDDAGVSYLCDVANQPAPDKEVVSFRITRHLKRRLDILAKKREQSLTELVENLMTSATRNVELSPDDYRQIAEATERARAGKKEDGRRKRPAAPRAETEA